MTVVLASRSPRRRLLVAALGVEVVARPADVDETPRAGEAPDALVRRLALAKARTVHAPGQVTLGGDTVVALGDEVLDQPRDRDDARRTLEQLRGRTADVVTHVVVLDAAGGSHGARVVSALHLADYDDHAIERYLATGEADDKAGALAVQGAAAPLVAAVAGCWSNVVGLPTCTTASLLRAAGVEVASAGPCPGASCLPPGAPEELAPPDRLRRPPP